MRQARELLKAGLGKVTLDRVSLKDLSEEITFELTKR